MIAVEFNLTHDTARPHLAEVIENLDPDVMIAMIGPALQDLLRRHYPTLPHNQMGGTPTNFWQQAGDSVRYEKDGAGVMIITDWQGVRQRYLGGTIRAVNKKYLAIPANAISYGKKPSEFENLHFRQFGRGQDAPRALVKLSAVSTDIAPKKRGRGFKAAADNLGMVVMFWLKDHVDQDPNPNVLPTDDQFWNTIEKALEPLIPS